MSQTSQILRSRGEFVDGDVDKCLEGISTPELARALSRRSDLASILRDDGLISPECYPLRTALGTVGTIDCVAIHVENGTIYGGIIRRKTGQKFAGLLALVGGIVARYENITDAIKRHWKQDLGLDVEPLLGWDWPIAAHQYAPQIDGSNREGFGEDPSKHSFGPDYAVIINGDRHAVKLGEKLGGQEAFGLEWYSAENCPPESDWGYDMRRQFLVILNRVEQLCKVGLLQF